MAGSSLWCRQEHLAGWTWLSIIPMEGSGFWIKLETGRRLLSGSVRAHSFVVSSCQPQLSSLVFQQHFRGLMKLIFGHKKLGNGHFLTLKLATEPIHPSTMLFSAQGCHWNAGDLVQQKNINLSLLQLSVVWWSVQVRGLNRAVASSKMFTLQVCRVFFPVWRRISSPWQKCQYQNARGTRTMAFLSVRSLLWRGGFVLWGCNTRQWWKKHTQRTA